MLIDQALEPVQPMTDTTSTPQSTQHPHGPQLTATLLWPDGAPLSLGDDALDEPNLTVLLPDDDTANGCGIIVCPGGGYRTLAGDHEGLQVAQWLNQQGIAAFVLRYRLGERYASSVSLLDGQRALRWVRNRSDSLGIDPNRLGMLGFSAGGHLACNVATALNTEQLNPEDPVDQHNSRPNFIVPVYAVTNGLIRGRRAHDYPPTEETITPDSPPAFIVATHEDSVVPASQSTLFYDALLAAGVRAELHIFNDGDHGLGLMPGDPDAGQWPMLLMRWLRRRGFLTDRPRLVLAGHVSVDGQPLAKGWLTLIPDDPTQPIARAYLTHHSIKDGGSAFTFDTADGPCAGPHVLQVHFNSAQGPDLPAGVMSLPAALRWERPTTLAPDSKLALELAFSDFQAINHP